MAWASGATRFVWESDNVWLKLGVLFPIPQKARKGILEEPILSEVESSATVSVGRVMLIAFFNSCGLVYQHYVTPKTTVNKKYNRDALEKLRSHISQKWPELKQI